MDQIVFKIYRFFLLPFVYGFSRFFLAAKFKNKFFETLRFRVKNEFQFRPTFDPKKNSIGIHAASGEIEYALPLIRKLKEKYPQFNIVVTLSSTSVLKSVQNQDFVDAVGPAPVDLFWLVENFLRKFKFSLFLFARTDVWPEISTQLKKNKVPSYLFSATFSQTSSEKGLFANSLSRWSLNNVDKIFPVTAEDKKNLESIGVKTPMSILGDTRYDQVFFKKHSTTKQISLPPNTRKIFVAGSTWIEDEKILFPAIVHCSKTWTSVIAPHEVREDGLRRFERFFESHGLKTERFSRFNAGMGISDWNVLIVDQYGYLFYLYRWADLAFVGGSFKSKVHSVMEPLSYFKPVCVGPFHTNNREALDFRQITIPFAAATYVQPLSSSEDLVSLLSLHEKIPKDKKNKMQDHLERLVQERRGATEQVLKEISF